MHHLPTIERDINHGPQPGESYFRVLVNVTHWTIIGQLFKLDAPVRNALCVYAPDDAAARQLALNYLINHGDRGEILAVEKQDVPF